MVMLEYPLDEARKLQLGNTYDWIHNFRGCSQNTQALLCRDIFKLVMWEQFKIKVRFDIVQDVGDCKVEGDTPLHACIIGPLPDKNTADVMLKVKFLAERIPSMLIMLKQTNNEVLLCDGSFNHEYLPTLDMFHHLVPEENVYHFYLDSN